MSGFDRDAFNRLCDEAHAALADLEEAAADFKSQVAHFHGVEPSQVQLFVVDGETRVEAVVHPSKEGE